jgi:hypothetical protein
VDNFEASKPTMERGCQMVKFAYQKSQFGYLFEGIEMGHFGMFYGHLAFKAIW